MQRYDGLVVDAVIRRARRTTTTGRNRPTIASVHRVPAVSTSSGASSADADREIKDHFDDAEHARQHVLGSDRCNSVNPATSTGVLPMPTSASAMMATPTFGQAAMATSGSPRAALRRAAER